MIRRISLFTLDGRLLKSFNNHVKDIGKSERVGNLLFSKFLGDLFNSGNRIHEDELNALKFQKTFCYFLRKRSAVLLMCFDSKPKNFNYLSEIMIEILNSFISEHGEKIENWSDQSNKFDDFLLPVMINTKKLKETEPLSAFGGYNKAMQYKDELINYIRVIDLPDTSKVRIFQIIEDLDHMYQTILEQNLLYERKYGAF